MISSIHNDIIRDQQGNGIVEKVHEKYQCQNREYYMPHKAVVRDEVQKLIKTIENDIYVVYLRRRINVYTTGGYSNVNWRVRTVAKVIIEILRFTRLVFGLTSVLSSWKVH